MMNKTKAIEEALNVLARPENADAAFKAFQESVGRPVVFSFGVTFLVMIFVGAFAEDQFGNNLWSSGGFWIVVGAGFLTAFVMVMMFPYLMASL